MKTISTDTIDAHEAVYLYRSQSQIPGSGIGLYSAIDIYKDENIAIFKGEILSDIQAEKRANNGNDKYFINLLDGSIMDSRSVMCFAKYANDAEGFTSSKFKNNARITLDENDKVCIQAIRDIRADEELFCSYGKGYWQKFGK